MKTISLYELKLTNKNVRLEGDVSDLEVSLSKIGQISPLIVGEDYELLAGGRRYKAMKNLGWENADCIICDKSDLEKTIISLDQNIQKGLTGVDLDIALAKRFELYLELHPETRHGTAGGLGKKRAKSGKPKKKSFAEDTSDKLALSTRSIQRRIARARGSSNELLEARRAGLPDSKANELIRLPKRLQRKYLNAAKVLDVRSLKKVVDSASSGQKPEIVQKRVEILAKDSDSQRLYQIWQKASDLSKRVDLAVDGNYRFSHEQDVNGFVEDLRKLSKGIKKLERMHSGFMRPTEKVVVRREMVQ